MPRHSFTTLALTMAIATGVNLNAATLSMDSMDIQEELAESEIFIYDVCNPSFPPCL